MAPARDLILGRRVALLLALGLLLLLCLAPGARSEGGEEGGSASTSSGPKGRADSPLWPATARDAAGLVCISIGLLIAAGGGIGGGGIIVALLILIQGLTPQQAIPISGVTVFGGAIANTISAATSRHPLAKGRPLIDFDVILQLEPPTVVGAVLGTFLNKLLPSIVVVVMLVVVLGLMGIRTMKKGLALLEAEGGLRAMCRSHVETPTTTAPESPAAAIEMSAAAPGSNGEESGARAGGATGASAAAAEDEAEEAVTVDDMEIVNLGPPMPAYVAKQATMRAIFVEYFRPWKWVLLSVWYVGVLLLTIFRGFVSRRSCGSLAYWLVVAAVLPWTGVFFWAMRRGILKEVQQKAAEGQQRLPGDVDWTPLRSLLYPLLCSIAGLFAGLFGVGGGIVKGPLMLEMGMLPPVVSACSSFMILMTTFASTLSFITFHMLKPDWALSYFALGFLCTSIGDRTFKVLLRKYKKQSPIVLSIGIVVVLAALLMTGESIQKMVNDPGSVKRIVKICPRKA